MDISHIENVGISDITDFFFSHYAPNNAILTLTGNITPEKALKLAEKWFGPIPARICSNPRIFRWNLSRGLSGNLQLKKIFPLMHYIKSGIQAPAKQGFLFP